MFYPAPAPAASAGTSTAVTAGKIICIVIIVIVSIFVILGAIGIALGVGLGVGLRNRGSSDSGTNSGTTASVTTSATTTVAGACSCGCSPVSIGSLLSRVINGNVATANSWPWMVYVTITNPLTPNRQSTCGGFLISDQHVVTAAHCVPNGIAETVDVYAGLQKVSLRTENDRRRASAILPHPSYDAKTFDNDIAVIKLASSYTLSSKIGPCCLPTGATSLPTTSQKAVIMGWGTTIDGVTSSVSDDLLQAVVQIQDSSTKCTVSSVKFCAGLGTTDTCQGDSGGPLLTNVNNQWTCTGVVSSGVGCQGFGDYARVSAFRSFIDNAVQTL